MPEIDWRDELRKRNETSRLEVLCDTPEEELTDVPQREERARWVAKNIRQVGDSVNGGYIIDTKTIKKLLYVRDDGGSYNMTGTKYALEAVSNDGVMVRRNSVPHTIFISNDAARRFAKPPTQNTPEEEQHGFSTFLDDVASAD